ncbi:MAG TPA: DEAD/DEAH box helicase, partial [Candidatus Xenobia bacterium]
MDYQEFFQKATGRPPYPYQVRLATEPWPDLLDIPTGLGKTAAVTLAWLWKRHTERGLTPRRLVYCLPMRVLVQQTYRAVGEWLAKLETELGKDPPTVHLLMGGEAEQRWDERPSEPSILIGTQDMLISRALNRGYGMSRYRWPVHFAQLNNDCLWLFDETQLMGVSVETSAQLDGLRTRFGTLLPTRSLWMSATLQREQLETVDHPSPASGWHRLALGDRDLGDSRVLERTQASKALEKSHLVLDKAGKSAYAADLAKWVNEHHKSGTLTLVVVNTVDRAQEISGALRKLKVEHMLLHSRYRPAERRPIEERLPELKEGILVSTQVVEAGVDLSARLLVTELAPWSSMVQRFGRCNRYGEQAGASVFWMDILDVPAPYEAEDLDRARHTLVGLSDASLTTVRKVHVETPVPVRPILRAKDLVDLFDTTPDLSGGDIDVSMYIRESEDVDVQVYWREWPSGRPDDQLPA